MSRRRQFNASLTPSAPTNAAPSALAESSASPAPRDGLQESRPSLPPGLSHPRAHARVTNVQSHHDHDGGGASEQRKATKGKQPVRKDEKELASLVDSTNSLSITSPIAAKEQESGSENQLPDQDSDVPPPLPDEECCFICAEPAKYWSVGVCEHRTCHVCAIRLRVFYKKTECTFCKTDLPTVLFTHSPTTPFPLESPSESSETESRPRGALDLHKYQYSDEKLGVVFEDGDMMEDTLLLLRFNCPNPTCAFMAAGWDGLEKHTLAAHGSVLCNLCRRQLSRFAHEQILYPPHLLALHDPSQLKRGQRKPIPRGKVEEEMVAKWGEPHPMCEFCHEAFFGSEELFKHMKHRHEECFVCKANGESGLYFQNYPKLEKHFNQAHFPCTEKECLEKKFVVFGSEIDWRAHMMAEHKSSMSSKDKYQARQVPIEFMGSVPSDFSFIPPDPAPPRRGAGASNGSGPSRPRQAEPMHQFSSQRRTRESRDPVQSQQLSQPMTRGNRRAGFGGTLTAQEAPESNNVSRASSSQGKARSGTSTPREDVDELTAARHADLLGRVAAMVDFSETKMSSFRHSIRSFRNNESGAKDMVDTVYSVLERDSDATLKVVREIASLMAGDAEKTQAILAAVNAFKIDRQNEFPSLGGPPTSVGTEYAGITTGKVLSAKRATQSSSSKLWDRVERAATSGPSSRPSNATAGPNGRQVPGAASSSQAFPALGGGGPSSKKPVAPAPSTGWANRASTTVAMPLVTMPPQPRSVNYPAASSGKSKPVSVSTAAFPGLPAPSTSKGISAADKRALFSGNNARQESIRRIAGDGLSPPPTNWGGSPAGASGSSTPHEETRSATGGKKKNKKEVLFTVSGR